MRAVVQRVKNAKVTSDGIVTGQIDKGIMALFGFTDGDDQKTIDYMLDKIINLRIFEDENEKLNLSPLDVNGGLLIVPNFTLYGDARKGRRPSYTSAAAPQNAESIYKMLLESVKSYDISFGNGIFQSHMDIDMVADGPVTILIDSERNF